VTCRSAAVLLMALLLASTSYPGQAAAVSGDSSITGTRPLRRLAQGCTTTATLTGTGGSVCNFGSAPATTTVSFTSSHANFLSDVAVAASQGVVCNAGTGTGGRLADAAAAAATPVYV
jgi:hypothetical protein